MKFYITLITSLLLFMSSQSFAQPEDWDDYINWAWKGSFSPFIEASYGYTSPGHEDITNTLSNIGLVDVKFGYGEYKEYSKFVYRLDERYLIGSYFSTDLNQIDDIVPGEINTEGWRVGLGTKIGYGYRLGSAISLIPYNQNQFTLTTLDYTRPQTISEVDNSILSRMEGTSRFGVSTEGGLGFFIAEAISINAAFEGAVVFPRWKVLHWLGSFTLQSLSTSLVNLFSESIIKASPIFGPLIYLVLQNAITFAWYYAMKSEQYWPISSETPFTMETFKIGASITF
jgi:hypothetical protein